MTEEERTEKIEFGLVAKSDEFILLRNHRGFYGRRGREVETVVSEEEPQWAAERARYRRRMYGIPFDKQQQPAVAEVVREGVAVEGVVVA